MKSRAEASLWKLWTMVWERSGDLYHATLRSPFGEVIFHLVAEKLGRAWDWSVWRPADPPERARHGVRVSVQEAVRDAEAAVQRQA